MRRAGLLSFVSKDSAWFNWARSKGHLPFFADGAENTGWQNFSINDAFELKLMVDMMGDPDPNKGLAGVFGLGPGPAGKIASRAAGLAVETSGTSKLTDIAGARPSIWVGVAVFDFLHGDDSMTERVAWFGGPLSDLPAWQVNEVKEGGGAGVRLFLANATRCASDVLQHAEEMGIISDPSEV